MGNIAPASRDFCPVAPTPAPTPAPSASGQSKSAKSKTSKAAKIHLSKSISINVKSGKSGDKSSDTFAKAKSHKSATIHLSKSVSINVKSGKSGEPDSKSSSAGDAADYYYDVADYHYGVSGKSSAKSAKEHEDAEKGAKMHKDTHGHTAKVHKPPSAQMSQPNGHTEGDFSMSLSQSEAPQMSKTSKAFVFKDFAAKSSKSERTVG